MEAEDNRLKNLRKENNLTQSECASILNISLRSLQNYEKNPKLLDTLRYEKLIKMINDYVDEVNRNQPLSIEYIKEKCNDVLSKYNVGFAYIFGSYAKGYATKCSDVDIFVDPIPEGFDYYGIKGDLEDALSREVDLMCRGIDIDNTDFIINQVMKDGFKIYG